MRILGSPGAFRHILSTVLLGAALLPAAGVAMSAGMSRGMVPLEEEEMAGVSGAGLAFAFEDIRFQMAPTSYIEQIGGPPGGDTSFNRGDLRWFGLAMTGVSGTGMTWTTEGGHGCGAGYINLGCPMTQSGIANYATHNNPFVLRVFDYDRVGRNASNQWVAGINATVLELLGPSNTDAFRWSFWGEIEASIDNGVAPRDILGVLQSQSIILGKPAARVRPPSQFGTTNNPMAGPLLQLFQSQTDGSLGLLYHSRLSGDYRLSVNQIAAGPDSQGLPRFTSQEGLYFTDVNAFLPLGQLHYQSIVLDGTGDGNFTIELTRLPNAAAAYNDLYQIAGQSGYQRTGRTDRYYETHGYVNWGTAFPTCGAANCLGGTGVSGLRYSGVDPDGPNRNVTNAEFGGSAVTATPQVGTVVQGATTREAIVAQGGISFVSRQPGANWSVPNNQNRAVFQPGVPSGSPSFLVEVYSTNCGLFQGCNNNAGRRANPNYLNNYNPLLQMDAINIGTARIEGMMFQHLKITSLGATNL